MTEQMHQTSYAQQTLPNLFCSQFVVIINMQANVKLNHNQQKSLTLWILMVTIVVVPPP